MKKYRKLSRFFKWALSYIIVFLVFVIIYEILYGIGVIQAYVKKLNDGSNAYYIITLLMIYFVAIGYVSVSLHNILSHRSIEDSRMLCLPIILSTFFLIMENGLLHALSEVTANNYYDVTMGVFSAVVVGVITFASLKFSFEVSTKQKRFIETSEVKPEIKIIYDKKNKEYVAKISRNNCYLSGFYYGEINKIEYADIKRTGNRFIMRNLYFPNRKILFECAKNGGCKTKSIKLNELDGKAPNINKLNKNYIFFVFRDKQNYYYFVQAPNDGIDYNVIGVNEYSISRLVHKFNKMRDKIDLKVIKYESMDWFRIPYNFYPEYKSNY